MVGLRSSKLLTACILLTVVVGMAGLSYAAVPLYRLFCQVTGYGGTTQIADRAPSHASSRIITVRFNADVAPDLSWSFSPAQDEIQVRVGEEVLAFYDTINESDETVVGSAVFNVTPLKAGIYFNKIDCFCFTEQVLAPVERAKMPVSFFIDPAILNDPNMYDLETITLSYTFYRTEGEAEKEDDQANLKGLYLAARTEV